MTLSVRVATLCQLLLLCLFVWLIGGATQRIVVRLFYRAAVCSGGLVLSDFHSLSNHS